VARFDKPKKEKQAVEWVILEIEESKAGLFCKYKKRYVVGYQDEERNVVEWVD
jgi:hypothetical protein